MKRWVIKFIVTAIMITVSMVWTFKFGAIGTGQIWLVGAIIVGML